MEFSKKLDLLKASILVSDFWGCEPAELVQSVASKDSKKMEEWNKIANQVIEFEKMGLEDRAKKLGIKLK